MHAVEVADRSWVDAMLQRQVSEMRRLCGTPRGGLTGTAPEPSMAVVGRRLPVQAKNRPVLGHLCTESRFDTGFEQYASGAPRVPTRQTGARSMEGTSGGHQRGRSDRVRLLLSAGGW